MSKRAPCTDEPVEMEVVRDFLPPPEDLVRKEEMVKVTLSLSRSSVRFFKRHARARRTSYQKMIRRVLDLYASHYR